MSFGTFAAALIAAEMRRGSPSRADAQVDAETSVNAANNADDSRSSRSMGLQLVILQGQHSMVPALGK